MLKTEHFIETGPRVFWGQGGTGVEGDLFSQIWLMAFLVVFQDALSKGISVVRQESCLFYAHFGRSTLHVSYLKALRSLGPKRHLDKQLSLVQYFGILNKHCYCCFFSST